LTAFPGPRDSFGWEAEAIAPGDIAALEALLPDRWLAAHPEHRLEQREEESREARARRRATLVPLVVQPATAK
jgi:hypothetical protein